jgi:streptogramin lyase
VACGESSLPGALSTSCSVNTDCVAPLVCAFRKCHTACTTSRDCQPGQRCVASDRPFHVCQLAEEAKCTYNSDCPEKQVCAVDLECRDECTTSRDCVSGQICVTSTCAEPVELVDGKLPMRGAEAGSASGRGQPCAYNSECPAPLVCLARSCAFECRTAADCKDGRDCANNRCITGSGTLIGPEGGVISADSGNVTLTVPAGALQSVISFVVQPLDAWPDGAVGSVFEILPTGLTFDVPAQLVVHYAAADLGTTDPQRLRVGRAVGATWTPLPSTVDLAASTVSASLAHLSVYGLVVETTNSDAGAHPGMDGGTAHPGTNAGVADGSVIDSGTTTDSGGAMRDTGPRNVFTMFPLSHRSADLESIAAGPDGNLWFTERTANQIGRITPLGAISEFPVPTTNVSPDAITSGPDGNLWFTEFNAKQIGRITPTGQITEFPVPAAGEINGQITTGPDGNLWFSTSSAIGRITPAGAATSFTTSGISPLGITQGPDGNLWFTNQFSGTIGRITPTGTFTIFPLPNSSSRAQSITTGPDGNLWLAEYPIGRMTPDGTVTEFPLSATAGQPWGITAGPDGNLWFTEFQTTGRVGRITPTGTVTEFFDTPVGDYTGITAGPDGNVWFLDTLQDRIGRVTP